MKKILICTAMTVMICSSVCAQENKAFKKGYRGGLELENMVLVNKDDQTAALGVTTFHGYSYGNGMYVGGGLGLVSELYVSDIERAQLFVESKYNFVDGHVSPFAQLRTGLEFNAWNNNRIGLFLSPAMGIDFSRFTLRISYRLTGTQAPVTVNSQRATLVGRNNWITCAFGFYF